MTVNVGWFDRVGKRGVAWEETKENHFRSLAKASFLGILIFAQPLLL